MSNLSYRKQYALSCFLRDKTNTRAFDNCFEMGDGGEVVKYLMSYANYATPERIEWAELANKNGVIVGSKEHKERNKIKNSVKLKEAIIRSGSWPYWEYFITHGTYAGFNRAA